MKEELYKTHNEVSQLGDLPSSAYESIFNMYKDQGEFYAYNIIKTVQFPKDLDDELFYYAIVTGSYTWTRLSFEHYGTIQLWWLICLTNKIMNPVKSPEPGLTIKILKAKYVSEVIDQIQAQL